MKLAKLTLFIFLFTGIFATSGFAASGLQVTQKLNQPTIQAGQELHGFITLKNLQSTPLKILGISASCGCTTLKLKNRLLAPQATEKIDLIIDTRGKMGRVEKTVTIYHNGAGSPHVETIAFHAVRSKDQDSGEEPIFQPPCSSCHLDPGMGKLGGDLYEAMCQICHVDGVKNRNRSMLKQITTKGISSQGMPAFSEVLDQEQLDSLIEWISTQPRKGK